MMINPTWKNFVALGVVLCFAGTLFSCGGISTKDEFFGKTQPPQLNIFRYVTGDEPQSLDPPLSLGQPEARIYMALYDGLVEYNPKNLSPMPSLAERWDINNDSSEFTFHLRQTGRWSNGDPIDANDFVYTFRRAVSPQLASAMLTCLLHKVCTGIQ
jgi:ABC-type oligopeptide transport system substrate-binding subunit